MRLEALIRIQQSPEISLEEIAGVLDVSVATVERWWGLYRKGGLELLLDIKQRGGYRHSNVPDELLVEIQRRRQSGELVTHADIQSWLRDTHGMSYSLSGIRYLLRRRPDPESSGKDLAIDTRQPPARRQKKGSTTRDLSPPTPVDRQAAPSISPDNSFDRVLALLAKLPHHFESAPWIESFRATMRSILTDVDHITVDINTRCDLLNPGEYQPDIRIAQSVGRHPIQGGLSVASTLPAQSMASQILADMQAQGILMDINHPPICREYHYEGTAYLGCLIFWRNRSRSPISQGTINLIDRLHDFIIYLFSDFVTRYNYAHPIDRLFFDILRSISEECHLTLRERSVLSLRLLGESYKVIADRLKISENAVGKHVTSIHQKTGTNGSVQLFAKYFSPRLAGVSNPLV